VAKRRPSTPAITRSDPAPVNSRSASAKGRQSSSARKPSPQIPRTLSNEDVGLVAGDVWQLLDKDGPQTVAAIKKAIGVPNDLVLAAIGWLAREDKLDFSNSGRVVKISLR
jgi:hypothetical protein